MFEYKCSSRNNLLFIVDGKIHELRPKEVIILKEKVDHPYLELLYKPVKIEPLNPKKENNASTRNRSV